MLKKVLKHFSSSTSNKENKDTNKDKGKINQKNEGQKEEKLETDAVAMDPDEETSYGNAVIPFDNNQTPTASTDMTVAAIQELTAQNNGSLGLIQNNNTSVINDPRTSCNVVNNPQNCTVMNISHVNGMHIGAVMNIKTGNHMDSCNFNYNQAEPQTKRKSKDKKPINVKTPSIVSMILSKEEPNHRLLDVVATHLGKDWKNIMRYLNFSDGQIEQAIIDHTNNGGSREVIYKLLLKWIESSDDGVATIGALTELLWNHEHYDVVLKMKKVWKEEQKQNSP